MNYDGIFSIIMDALNGTKYSRVGQVKYVEDSL